MASILTRLNYYLIKRPRSCNKWKDRIIIKYKYKIFYDPVKYLMRLTILPFYQLTIRYLFYFQNVIKIPFDLKESWNKLIDNTDSISRMKYGQFDPSYEKSVLIRNCVCITLKEMSRSRWPECARADIAGRRQTLQSWFALVKSHSKLRCHSEFSLAKCVSVCKMLPFWSKNLSSNWISEHVQRTSSDN